MWPGLTQFPYFNYVMPFSSLRHHRIVAIIGYCFEADPPFIITEFMVKGSAVDVLRTGLLQLAHKLQMVT